MNIIAAKGGTKQDPWKLKTPPGTSTFEAYRDETSDPPALVVQVGTTQLRYYLRAIDDLHAMLKARRAIDAAFGSADEQKPAAAGTVEASRASRRRIRWAVGHGLKKGLRGRFGMYVLHPC